VRAENDCAYRDAICEWLRANGVDPGMVPTDAFATTDGNQCTVEVYRISPKGSMVFNDARGRAERGTTTFTVEVAPTALVMEWLRPACPACGR
jgi:hypothetical protein